MMTSQQVVVLQEDSSRNLDRNFLKDSALGALFWRTCNQAVVFWFLRPSVKENGPPGFDSTRRLRTEFAGAFRAATKDIPALGAMTRPAQKTSARAHLLDQPAMPMEVHLGLSVFTNRGERK